MALALVFFAVTCAQVVLIVWVDRRQRTTWLSLQACRWALDEIAPGTAREWPKGYISKRNIEYWRSVD